MRVAWGGCPKVWHLHEQLLRNSYSCEADRFCVIEVTESFHHSARQYITSAPVFCWQAIPPPELDTTVRCFWAATVTVLSGVGRLGHCKHGLKNGIFKWLHRKQCLPIPAEAWQPDKAFVVPSLRVRSSQWFLFQSNCLFQSSNRNSSALFTFV